MAKIWSPTVTTQACTNVAYTSATGNGTITDTGGANCSRRGFCYMEGTSGDPTTANSVVYDDGSFGTGSFSKTLTPLTEGTNYRVRAYAVNSNGTGYGTTVDLQTTGGSEPQSGTANYADEQTPTIYQPTGAPGGVAGGANYVDAQAPVVYQPDASWDKVGAANYVDQAANAAIYEPDASWELDFDSDLTSLDPDTHYYVRAYATTTNGTAYGDEEEFDSAVGDQYGAANFVERTPVVYGPDAAWDKVAEANLVEHTPATYEGTGQAGAILASAEYLPRSPTLYQADATWDAVAESNYVESTSAVHEATGVPSSSPQYGTANLVEHAPATYEATGAPGSVSGGAEYLEHPSDAYQPSGTPGSINASANYVERTPVIYEATPSYDQVGGANYVESTPAVYQPTGASGVDFNSYLTSLDPATHYYVRAYATTINGTAYGDEEEFDTDTVGAANLVESTPTVYQASGAPGAVIAAANYIEHAPVVYEPSGVGEGDVGSANFVERTPVIYESSGVPGSVQGSVQYVERTPTVYQPAGFLTISLTATQVGVTIEVGWSE